MSPEIKKTTSANKSIISRRSPRGENSAQAPRKDTSGRARDGQPGKQNARKHGLYSRYWQELDFEDLERLTADLADEIALLRVTMRRVDEAGHQAEATIRQAASQEGQEPSWDELLGLWITTLKAQGTASARLAKLLLIQRQLAGGKDGDSVVAVLHQALQQVNQDLKL
jgi:hypothetical protein